MKRIVEETRNTGNVLYAIESNRFFGFPCKWRVLAYLNDLEKAYNYIGFHGKEGVQRNVIKRRIIW